MTDKNIEDHVARDKDCRFHGTSIAQGLRALSGMNIGLYLEVQMIWETSVRSRELVSIARDKYKNIVKDLKSLLEEHSDY